ncbi:MAG: hypothetical protein AB2777_16775 [Candidatus Thiodiazotropha endolucinida]
MRYEPSSDPAIDFTWEREWRLNDFELHLDGVKFRVLLPGIEWAEELERIYEHDREIDERIHALEYGDEYYGFISEDIPFTYSIINA